MFEELTEVRNIWIQRRVQTDQADESVAYDQLGWPKPYNQSITQHAAQGQRQWGHRGITVADAV